MDQPPDTHGIWYTVLGIAGGTVVAFSREIFNFLLKRGPQVDKAEQIRYTDVLKEYQRLRDEERESYRKEHRESQVELEALRSEVENLREDNIRCLERYGNLQRQYADLSARFEFQQIAGYPHVAELSGNVCCDENGLIVDWNPSATAIFGWTRSEMIGKPITILMATEFVGQHLSAFQRLQATKEKYPRHGVLRGQGRNKLGEAFDAMVVLSMWTEEGRPVYQATIRKAPIPPVTAAADPTHG